jgi:hypothetical protein
VQKGILKAPNIQKGKSKACIVQRYCINNDDSEDEPSPAEYTDNNDKGEHSDNGHAHKCKFCAPLIFVNMLTQEYG